MCIISLNAFSAPRWGEPCSSAARRVYSMLCIVFYFIVFYCIVLYVRARARVRACVSECFMRARAGSCMSACARARVIKKLHGYEQYIQRRQARPSPSSSSAGPAPAPPAAAPNPPPPAPATPWPSPAASRSRPCGRPSAGRDPRRGRDAAGCDLGM